MMQRTVPALVAMVMASGASHSAAQDVINRIKLGAGGLPSDDTHFKAVSTSNESSVGIRPDGTLIWWDGNGPLPIVTASSADGIHLVPSNGANEGFVFVSEGYDHGVAVRADGTYLAWYEGPFIGNLGAAGVQALPSDLKMFTVACGEGITVVIPKIEGQSYGPLQVYGYDYGCYPQGAAQPPSGNYTRVSATGHFFLAEVLGGSSFLKYGPFPVSASVVSCGCSHYSCIFSKVNGSFVNGETITPGGTITGFSAGHSFMLFLDDQHVIPDRSNLEGDFGFCNNGPPWIPPNNPVATAGCNQFAQLGNSDEQGLREAYLLDAQPMVGTGTRFRYSQVHGGYKHGTGVVFSDSATTNPYPKGSLVSWGQGGVFSIAPPFGYATVSSNYDHTVALGACYANCDESTAAPVLNVNDFGCFVNLFNSGSLGANCDGSTVAPVLNVNDFTCFMNKYAAGCS